MFSLLASVAIAVSLAVTSADADKPTTKPTEPKRLVVTRGSTILLQMTSKRPIVRVEVDREDVIRVVPENATTLRLTGVQPGIVRLTLYDDKGNVEKKQMGR